ncbi:MAG: NAD(P)/FAD-dependent oxidoreductase [Lachnospiraceae bacterium]|nr:NAD(P)/FAD-dependent oxidoreductase [Lachnospiraceae bacterium]
MRKRVGIIGGGAAGMMAAITAARCGAEVTILEGGERIGKKLLSTGNGKCNLGNEALSADCYYGSCAFLSECFSDFGVKETQDFFEGLGVLLRSKNGYLYPYAEQASIVLDALRFEIEALGIQVETQARVSGVRVQKDGTFAVESSKGVRRFDRVILACGSKAAPKTGSDGSGYDLAKSLGHRIVPVMPALTALKCKESFFKAVTGVRAEALIRLWDRDGKYIQEERGELQLTEYGISGIPTFQLSRTAAYMLQKQKEVSVTIDFLPDVDDAQLESIASKRMEMRGNRSVEELFNGLANKKVMALLIKLQGLKAMDSSKDLSKKDILGVLQLTKKLKVTAIGTGDFQNCQVSAGGVDPSQIDRTMESKLIKGLYIVGELLDVDGRCGGYNLQWAWTSGYLAGKNAAGGEAK